MRNRLPILLLLFVFLLASCGTETATSDQEIDAVDTGKFPTKGLILTQGTAIRLQPLIFSSRIDQLDKGASVNVLSRSAKKSWIGNNSDYWYQVEIHKGVVGWMYGSNLQIVDTDDDKKMQELVNRFWKEESDEIMKQLHGSWWSVNDFGDFTLHGLELHEDGEYHSYWKGGKAGGIKGTFSLNFKDTSLEFEKGTTFKHNLKFRKQGQEYQLYQELEDQTLRFKKIAMETEEEKKEKAEKQGTPTPQ